MEKNKNFAFIILLSFILFFLIVLQIIIKNIKKQTQFTNLEFKKENTQKINTLQYQPTNLNIKSKKSFPKALISPNVFEKEITEKIDQLKNKTPAVFFDFEIDYSYPTDTFIIYEKTPQAKEKFLAFLKENQLENLEDKKIFIFTKDQKEKYQEKIEDSWIKNKQSSFLTQKTFPTLEEDKNKNSLSFLADLLKIIIITPTLFPSASITPPIVFLPSFPSPKISQTTPIITQPIEKLSLPPTSLSEIFEEVSNKVGVPKRILEAVLRIETPSTFNLLPLEIQKYSTPGNFLPNCGPNICSATGPMQMTIGVDKNGNPSCPLCGVGFCPNAWALYGKAVNVFSNYSHQPNPCNLKDNIYAAAWKLKNDSGATDPLNWTKEQVFKAATRYYGSCKDKYRYARLGGRTYCEYVWDYYQGSL